MVSGEMIKVPNTTECIILRTVCFYVYFCEFYVLEDDRYIKLKHCFMVSTCSSKVESRHFKLKHCLMMSRKEKQPTPPKLTVRTSS